MKGWPCKNCKERKVGCHASCGKYKLFRSRLKWGKNHQNKSKGIMLIKLYWENDRTKY